VASAPLLPAGEKPVYGIAAGDGKVPAMLGALNGKFINCLITNETTAEQLLKL
jgi:DNA-binding transcriptional regulator LsrR (DeoR family)